LFPSSSLITILKEKDYSTSSFYNLFLFKQLSEISLSIFSIDPNIFFSMITGDASYVYHLVRIKVSKGA